MLHGKDGPGEEVAEQVDEAEALQEHPDDGVPALTHTSPHSNSWSKIIEMILFSPCLP